MKSRNRKGKPTTPRNSEEDLTLPQKSSAFTFLKNRFFQQQQPIITNEHHVTSNNNNSISSNGSSPRLSTSSTRSNLTITKPWNIDNTTTNEALVTSKSFDEHSVNEEVMKKNIIVKSRPVSMMGLEMLSNEDVSVVIPRKKNNSINKKENRTSLIIIKEGYLYKKTDFKPFHKQTKLDRGWKLYKVVLRGHKLYLYKLTTESPLKSLFPSITHSSSQHSLTTTTNSLQSPSEFDLESQSYVNCQGLLCLNQSNLQQNYLILSNDGQLISCSKNMNNLWKIDLKVSISILKIEQQSSDYSHSSGSLLFNILYTNQPSTLGIYSTLHRDVGLNWIKLFCAYKTNTVTTTTDTITIDEEETNTSSRMYDATQRYHPDLILKSRNDRTEQDIIQGGTINALIHELLFNYDNHFLNVFLLNYSNFTTGKKILNQFKFILTNNSTVESRLMDIFVIWCKEFSLDIMGDLVSTMMNILDLDIIQDKEKANQLKELVLETVEKNTIKNCDNTKQDLIIITAEKSNELQAHHQDDLIEEEEDHHVENISAFIIEGKRRDSINLSNLLITGLTFDLFLTIDPTSFANQIYLFHYKKHQQYKNELLNPLSYIQRPQISIQMLNSLLFTTVSPHFLTKLIRNQILIETQQLEENSLFTRSKLLEHWIKIGIHLFELGDITGWTAIAMGICSVGIVRLRETWKSVDRTLVDIVQLNWITILSNHGLFNQNLWSKDWENQLEFSQVLQSHAKSGLPFFGTIRQSVDRLRKHIKLLISPNIINFMECVRIHDTIMTSLENYKKKSSSLESCDLPSSVGPLQSFFEHSVTDLMSVPHDFKYLQECSLACEPRIFGQGFDRRKFNHRTKTQHGTDVAPPSTSSLTFPSILDNCTLLEVEQVSNSNSSSGLVSTHSSISIASSQPSMKKHPRKLDTSNSIRSIRSFLEDGSKKSPSLSHMGTSNTSLNNKTTLSYDIVSPSRSANRKAFRRRTYSFPPGSGNTNSSTSSRLDLLESENNRTWLGSLISNRHHRTYSTKALIEAHRKSRAAQYGHNGEIILSVQQNELVFKASAILEKNSTQTSENSLKKVESVHSIDFLKKDESSDEEGDALLVTVKAGYLDHLVDSLVRGVLPHEEALKDQWQMMSLTEGFSQQIQPEKIAMDEEEYINVFFMTYRIYCSSTQLFNLLKKKFMEAQSKCKLSVKKRKNSLTLLETYFTPDTPPPSEKVSSTETYDWKKVADIQLRVINLFIYWIEEHHYDFIDEVETSRYMDQFLNNAKKCLQDWRLPLMNQHTHNEALVMAETIEQKMVDLQTLFIRKSLSPCYDMKSTPFDPESTRGAEELYRQLTSQQKFHTTLQLATNKLVPLSISTKAHDCDAKSLVDRFAPEALLEQVDKAVRQLFSAVTMQDWIQTFDVFEAQSSDIYAWLPARKPSRTSRMSSSLSPVEDAPSSHVSSYHVLADEAIISDIFTAMEGARRSVVSPSAFSDDDLLLAFPGSIQYLYCMHYIIRSWVMNEICNMEIDSKTRVLRIEKFLQIVMISKISSEKMTLFPELKESNGRVPGFVEYAIASALVSPEVRLFTKAWNDVAMQHGHASLDTLENLLNQIQKTQPVVSSRTMTASYSSTSLASCYQQLVVPSLGWIFERIMELCFHIPDTFDKKENMINFDKRRCVYQFLQLIMNVQVDLDEQQVEAKGISMSFLISPCPTKDTWKNLRELASRENKKTSSSIVLRGPTSKSHVSRVVFHKLVNEQLDKLKRDFKERDRIDKEWLSLQHKLQKKQLEQARQVEKLDRKGMNKSSTQQQLQQVHSVMPRLNSFLRNLRPHSIVASPIHHVFPSNIDISSSSQYNHPTATKASTVINLIHSTTSIASTYTKRDFVFRIVTEEGGQYLFQAMNRQDMQEWMQHVNFSAREGAAKRQSVLAAESLDYEGEHRQNVAFISGNRNQAPSRSSVYGVTLDSLMKDGQVPLVVEKCINEIERRGLEEVGIYRVAGTGSVVSALKAEFNKDVNKVDMDSPRWADINVVADAFKQFLRELPEPLLTYTFYDEFIKASASEDHDERVYLIKKVIKKLPASNYILLKRIIEHFVTVTDFEAMNHMYATNLAIVFGPTLLQPTPGPASFATTMSNLGHHQNIVKYLILNYHYLFDVESDEVECKEEEEHQEET